jgi:ATP/maltotriose-dependent transcriptional regulator MalT
MREWDAQRTLRRSVVGLGGRCAARDVSPLPPPAHVVDRPGLRDQLDGVVQHSLALLVAPAGTGKSVLLAQWVGMHPEPAFVWLEIGSFDDDPAERCFVSVNTIKTHMAHIYRKLDVANRSGAIRRAQDIGLL